MIYLASPYSSPDAQVRYTRFLAAQEYAAKQLASGEALFSPIAYGHQFAMKFGMKFDAETWAPLNNAVVERCSRVDVLTLPGWEQSRGIAAEIELAEKLGKPIRMVEVAA